MKIDIYEYWSDPPPEPSPRLALWISRLKNGWRPNRRIGTMNYTESAEFFGVYLWEYLNIIYPSLYKQEENSNETQAKLPD